MQLDSSSFKRCRLCECTKPATPQFFAKNRSAKDGRKNECKVCSSLAYRDWYQGRGSQWKREYNKEWWVQNRERMRLHHREWARGNKDRRNAYRRELLQRNEAYRLRSNRDSEKRERGVKYSKEAIEYAEVLYNDPCSYCGTPADTIDHIVSVSAGGGSEIANLTAACKRCNSSKGNRDLLGFLLDR